MKIYRVRQIGGGESSICHCLFERPLVCPTGTQDAKVGTKIKLLILERD